MTFVISMRGLRGFCCMKRRRVCFRRILRLFSAKAQRHLEQLGVKVFTSTRVTSIDADGIIAGGQRVQAATVLWGAGVLAFPAGRWINSTTDKSGRIIDQLRICRSLSHPEIFAIGDTAHVVVHSRNLLGIKSNEPMLMPGLAQPAIQEGRLRNNKRNRRRLSRRRMSNLCTNRNDWTWAHECEYGAAFNVGRRTYSWTNKRINIYDSSL